MAKGIKKATIQITYTGADGFISEFTEEPMDSEAEAEKMFERLIKVLEK